MHHILHYTSCVDAQPDDTEKARRHQAALARIGKSATAYFTTTRGPYGSPRSNTHMLPQVRAPEELVRQVADYGNAHRLTFSETMRSLLRMGLEKAEEQHEH